MTLTVLSIAFLIWFVMGVIASRYVVAAVATVQSFATRTYNGLLLVQMINAYGARIVFTSYVDVYRAMATSTLQRVAAVATSLVDGLVDALTNDLADTSIYALTVSAGSSEFAAGEYLIRDNGQWRNVYLTQHARALIGTSADVIALQPATVVDAAGSSRVWTVAIA